jgi:hypothetical protein
VNLHALVGPVVSSVNPTIRATLRQSTGPSINPDFSQTPTYGPPTPIDAQIQALQFTDLKQIEGLGITGLRRKAYLYGNVNGIVRGLRKGGDLVTLPDGSEWLIVFVFETYGHGLVGQLGWCSVCLTAQNPTSEG